MKVFTIISILASLSFPLVSSSSDDARRLQTSNASPATNTPTSSSPTTNTPPPSLLQFGSLGCNTKKNNCGQLNGFQLICQNLGVQDGEEKNQCTCEVNDLPRCQNTSALAGTVPQFGDCSKQPCVSSMGFVPLNDNENAVAEPLHCVKEAKTSATEPAMICHTCQSCLYQNDGKGQHLMGDKRFNCNAICPKSVLKSLKVDEKDPSVSKAASPSDEKDKDATESADENPSKDQSSSKIARVCLSFMAITAFMTVFHL